MGEGDYVIWTRRIIQHKHSCMIHIYVHMYMCMCYCVWLVCVCLCVRQCCRSRTKTEKTENSLDRSLTYTYMYICVCVCVCVNSSGTLEATVRSFVHHTVCHTDLNKVFVYFINKHTNYRKFTWISAHTCITYIHIAWWISLHSIA